MEVCKVYVDVKVYFSKEGRLTPMSIIWRDGRIYEIQHVTEVRRAPSLQAGGIGMRYTCMIEGRESHLFYDDHNRWFVEGRC